MKKILNVKVWMALLICFMCVFSSIDVFAWPGPGKGDHSRVVVHDRYYYRGGHWSRPSWFGFNFFVSAPPMGAFVEVLPAGYSTVVISHRRFFRYENVYYEPYETGYIVTQPPVTVTTVITPIAQPQGTESITVNIPNSNGSFTPVTLVKQNGGYVGPQGEFYPSHPTVEQLKVLYGK
jgi:hypothetical protein